MSRKVFIVDIAKCNGCHNCQVACKDEHCGTDWLPYAAEQPMTGQFWCKVEEKVHGTVPKVNITYTPHFGAQTSAIADYAPEVLMEREDGLVVIDPSKAKGRKDIAEKFDGVFYNETLDICQGCTGCAHLLDDGWSVPRCVDACATRALRFGDESEFAEEIASAEQLDPKSNVYYLNLPKKWVAGQVYDGINDNVVIGAKVSLISTDGTVLVTETDEFGDFWFKQIDGGAYHMKIETERHVAREIDVDCTNEDVNIGALPLYTLDFK